MINELFLQNDGGGLAAIVTCASLALADAALEMYDLVCGASAMVADDGRVLMDPTKSELEHEAGSVTVVCTSQTNELTGLWTSGRLEGDLLLNVVAQCIGSSVLSQTACRQCLKRNAWKL